MIRANEQITFRGLAAVGSPQAKAERAVSADVDEPAEQRPRRDAGGGRGIERGCGERGHGSRVRTNFGRYS